MANEAQANQKANVEGGNKITVMNPVGYPPKITPKPMAPRLESLDGKTLYLVEPRFDDSGLFLRQVQGWFADHVGVRVTEATAGLLILGVCVALLTRPGVLRALDVST